ncbi:MAG: S41 family peptidase [Candidatus Zixiibacteriota bacterium]
MFKNKKKLLLPLTGVLLFAVALNVLFANTDDRDNVFKQLKQANDVFTQTIQNYVDPIDYEKFFMGGIKGALRTLDPHTTYFMKKDYDDLKTETKGEFYGLGIVISIRDNILTVISPIEGTPAYRQGLQAGDQIIEIEGKSTRGFTSQDAVEKLRGPKDTEVTITVRRPGEPKPMEYTFKRALVEIKSVPFYGMTEEGVGFIRLTRFSQKATSEIRDAIEDLESKNAKGIILDLRSNPGGLLNEAVKVASMFLESGDLIVYTEGAETYRDKSFNALPMDVKYDTGKLIVLLNRGSASASEIVAGAIQDHDRGLVMGQRSFGKGLVQTVIPLHKVAGTALKITTAKYYIPSGRCIQKESYLKWKNSAIVSEFTEDDTTEGDIWGEGYFFESREDSLEEEKDKEDLPEYETDGGRTVYGGGGIMPDIKYDTDELSPLEIALERKSVFFRYAVQYVAEHDDIGPDFEITDEIMEDFMKYVEDEEFEFELRSEIEIEKLEKIIEDAIHNDDLQAKLDEFKMVLEQEKESQFVKSHDYITRAIRREIITGSLGQEARYQYDVLINDEEVRRAVEIILSDDEYASYFNFK